MFSNPLKALKVSLRGVRTEGSHGPRRYRCNSARPAVYDYEEKVKQWSIEVKRREAGKQEDPLRSLDAFSAPIAQRSFFRLTPRN